MTQAPPPGDPQYGQPQYGQPQYGQPQYGQPPPAAPGGPPPPSRTPGRSIGVSSLVLTLLGAVAVLVGLFGVRWTELGNADGGSSDAEPKFLLLRKLFIAIDDAGQATDGAWTIAYFRWAAFVLLAATLVMAVLAALPTPAAGVFRALGFVVGLVSAAAALLAPALDGTDGLDDYLKGGFGLYLAAGGSLLMAIGALIGSRRRI